MDSQSLKTLLKRAELTKKEMAEIVGLSHSAVNNWGSSTNVPHWVESWLILYIQNKNFRDLKEKIIGAGLCEEMGGQQQGTK